MLVKEVAEQRGKLFNSGIIDHLESSLDVVFLAWWQEKNKTLIALCKVLPSHKKSC